MRRIATLPMVLATLHAACAWAAPAALIGVIDKPGFEMLPVPIAMGRLDLGPDGHTRAPEALAPCVASCNLGTEIGAEGALAADPDGRRAYNAAFPSGVIEELDVTDGTVLRRLVFGDGLHTRLLARHPTLPVLAVLIATSPARLVMVSTDTFSVIAEYGLAAELGAQLAPPVFSADGETLFVVLGKRLMRMDGRTGQPLAAAAIGSPFRPRYDRDRRWIWGTNGMSWDAGDRVLAFDADTLTPVREIALGGYHYDVRVNGDGTVTIHWNSSEDRLTRMTTTDADGNVLRSVVTETGSSLPGSASRSIYTVGRDMSTQPPKGAMLVELDRATMLELRRWRLQVPLGVKYPLLNRIAFLPEPAVAIEYYHAALDHYFLTADADEIDALDRGAFSGWQRTGESFKVMRSDAATSGAEIAVCRFYGLPARGLDSHFYTASPTECDAVEHGYDGAWVKERADAFYVVKANETTGVCPGGTSPVYRLWNARFDSNHRYTTSAATKAQMIMRGYVPEGSGPDSVAFCART